MAAREDERLSSLPQVFPPGGFPAGTEEEEEEEEEETIGEGGEGWEVQGLKGKGNGCVATRDLPQGLSPTPKPYPLPPPLP